MDMGPIAKKFTWMLDDVEVRGVVISGAGIQADGRILGDNFILKLMVRVN